LEQREPFQWTEQKAFWYLRAVEYNDYPVALLKVILPLLKGCKSVVDVGAGCGAFALALARVLPTVTALEPSPAMAGLLRQRALSMGLSNIELIEAPFQEAEVAPHDAVLCAFLQEAHEELESFLSWVERVAKRRVILVRSARRGEDKLFLGELSRLVGGKEHPKRSDYLETVVKLHERGIFTNVSMVEFNLDQPFDDLDEALQFWREYLKLEDDHHDEALREFLGGRLVGVEGGPVASVPHLSAVLWWDLP
jgi:SAM-dependent methyltransferase